MYVNQKPSRRSVILANVFKTHNGRTIFDGINFTAFSGKICAVLGGLESGKSMLLSCIVGGNDFDSGQMWVLGGKPQTKSSKTFTKHVGYMPQEFCLYEKMTVLELILYFGYLYDINSKFILWRLRYYNDFFTFPSSKSLIKDLSEKRIVSFILTVFHRPRLIVLDEPTAGLDISKKNQVWSYIHHMVHTWQPTIIVATNNVEEASLATNIVYLKDGKIIFDHDVSDLKKNHPNRSLEHIVGILYTKRMANLNEDEWLHSNESIMPHDKVLTKFERLTPKSSIRKLKTITIKNIRVLLRSKWLVFILFILPAIQTLLFCMHYGKFPKPMPISVFNQESSCENQFACKHLSNCTYYSCLLIHLMHAFSIDPVLFENVYELEGSVESFKSFGYIKIPKNYTQFIIETMLKTTQPEKRRLFTSELSIGIDVTRLKFSDYLNKLLLNCYNTFLANIYKHFNTSTEYADLPLKIYEDRNLDIAENTAIGMISCCIFTSALIHYSLMFHREILNGHMSRNIIAGTTFLEVVLSYLILQIIFSLVQAFGLFLIVDSILYLTWQSSLLLVIILNVTLSICGMSMGFLIGASMNDSKILYQIAIASCLLTVIFSGVLWPVDTMPLVLYSITEILPLHAPIEITRGILVNDRRVKSLEVWISFLNSSCWIIISFIGAVYMLKRKPLKNKINFNY